MPAATASISPWFTHRRMWSKWGGLALTGALAAVWWQPWSALALLLGLLWFFPNEYVVHRWVYHRSAVGPDPSPLAKSHIRHHVDPTDLDYIFNPPQFSVGIGFVYLLVAWAITRDIGLAAAFSAGNFLGLVYYEYVHFTAHRPGVTPALPWLPRLKRMHLWHHYKSEHHWFGVTTRVHDKLFRSHPEPTAVQKSDTVRSLVPPESLKEWVDAA